MGPLNGITVVALEQAVAAPFATRQLADLGARVIKIERPGTGDFARHYDRCVLGQSSYFVWLNRGKESVELDVQTAAGKAALATLLAGADVFVQNLGPGAAGRLGLDPERLRADHPRLICCTVTGYGVGGPYQHKKAYDLLIQCETGLLSVTGTPEQPSKAGISVADIAAGMYAYSGVLTALYERERTGQGSSFDVALLDALGEWMTQPYYYTVYGGQPARRTGARHASISPYGPYSVSGGGQVFLGLQNDREWAVLCERVLGRPDLVTDPRFATNPDRVDHDAELTEIIEDAVRPLSPDEVTALLDQAGIANARLRTPAEFGAHPQLAARDRWREIGTPAGPVRALLPPVSVAGQQTAMGAVPRLGQHTATIMAELAARRAVQAWALATAGDESQIREMAGPDTVRWLLNPVRKPWRVAPGPRIGEVTIAGLDVAGNPQRVQVSFPFTGRRLHTASGETESDETEFVGMLTLELAGPGQPEWRVTSGRVETLDEVHGYVFTAPRHETPQALPRRFRITASFAEHDERFGSTVSIEVQADAAPGREEAERLVWPAVEAETARALGPGDWRPSLNSLDVVEIR